VFYVRTRLVQNTLKHQELLQREEKSRLNQDVDIVSDYNGSLE